MGSVEPVAPGPRWIDSWTRGQGEARARSLMQRTWGVDASAVWSAPGRVIIVGEHTDYSGGLSLPTVTPHRTFIAARLRDDGAVRIVSERGHEFEGPGERWEGDLDTIDARSARGWPSYVAGVLWALRERGFDGPGMDLAVTSCVPPEAGLGSSGALGVATARAVNALWGLALDADDAQVELAEACVEAEREIAGAPVGGVDQHAQLRCREGEAIEVDFAQSPPAIAHRPLYFPDYGLAMLVVVFGTPRRERIDLLAARVAECAAAARSLGVDQLGALTAEPQPHRRAEQIPDPALRRRARHVLTEVERVRDVMAELAGTGPAHERFAQVGRQLQRSHASLVEDFDASTPEQRMAVEAAAQVGAVGARASGAGLGGCAVVLVRRRQAEVAARRIDRTLVEAGHPRPRFVLL